jgi:hypothetical protein
VHLAAFELTPPVAEINQGENVYQSLSGYLVSFENL